MRDLISKDDGDHEARKDSQTKNTPRCRENDWKIIILTAKAI